MYGSCSESFPTKTGKSPTGSRRTWAFAPLCPRDCQAGADLGVVIGRPALLAPLTLPGRARVAPAERERKGIRGFPGPKDSPRAPRFIGTSMRNGQPSPAGGMEVRALRGPTRRGDFFSWTVHGPFSFCQEQKENGGWNPAAMRRTPPGDHRSPLRPVPSDGPPAPRPGGPFLFSGRPGGRFPLDNNPKPYYNTV